MREAGKGIPDTPPASVGLTLADEGAEPPSRRSSPSQSPSQSPSPIPAPVTDPPSQSRPPSPVNEPGSGVFSIIRGRPYNNQLQTYRFPVDQIEVTRLDRIHQVLTPVGLYHGPVDELLCRAHFPRVLDVGCGTGVWLTEMAQRFPSADCVGIDFLEQQHTTERRNVTFMSVNVPRGLDVFAPRSFDVVHIRNMVYAIPDYRSMLEQAHRILRPGGLLLIHEPNLLCYSNVAGTAPEELAPALVAWSLAFRRALLRRGIDMHVFDRMDTVISSVGFEGDHHAFFRYFPLCPNGGEAPRGGRSKEVECTHELVASSRITIVEGGEYDHDQYDALERAVATEVQGSGGVPSALPPDGAGATVQAGGASNLYSPWGYWWSQKSEAVEPAGQITKIAEEREEREE